MDTDGEMDLDRINRMDRMGENRVGPMQLIWRIIVWGALAAPSPWPSPDGGEGMRCGCGLVVEGVFQVFSVATFAAREDGR